MTTTEILPNQTPIGGFGLSVNGSDQNGTKLVFGNPPLIFNRPLPHGPPPQEPFLGAGRRGSAASFLGPCAGLGSLLRPKNVRPSTMRLQRCALSPSYRFGTRRPLTTRRTHRRLSCCTHT
jgi:hypothetical protein